MRDSSSINESWKDIDIKSSPSKSVIIGPNCLQGRRIQYHACHNVSQTIHKVLEQTFPYVAIQMLPDEEFEL